MVPCHVKGLNPLAALSFSSFSSSPVSAASIHPAGKFVVEPRAEPGAKLLLLGSVLVRPAHGLCLLGCHDAGLATRLRRMIHRTELLSWRSPGPGSVYGEVRTPTSGVRRPTSIRPTCVQCAYRTRWIAGPAAPPAIGGWTRLGPIGGEQFLASVHDVGDELTAAPEMAQDVGLALGRGSIHEWPPGTHTMSMPVRSANSRAVSGLTIRSKHPHTGRIGIPPRDDALDLGPQVHGHEHRPHRQGATHGAEVAPGVGPQPPQRRRQPSSDEEVGRVQHGGHEEVGHAGHVGQHRSEQRHEHAASLLPARGRRAVAVDDAQDPLGMGVGELHGDGTTHGVPQRARLAAPRPRRGDGRPRPEISPMVTRSHGIGSLPANPGRLGLRTRQPERLGEVAALSPVHPPAGEVPVEVDGPDGLAPRAFGTMRASRCRTAA